MVAHRARPVDDAEFAAALAGLASFETHPLVAVATSGGADSLALTILADRWARARGGVIQALSVDHRLRPESAAEIRDLAEWLRSRGIRHEILVWAGDKPATGIEEAARAARYDLLTAWCRAHGCLHLLLAHHREDQIETCLIRRRAGSGPDGLAGMPAIREFASCRLLRPLLGFPKARLLALLKAERQPWISDPSNSDPAFERARLRANLASAAEGERLAAAREIRRRGCERRRRERQRERLLAVAVALHPAGFAVVDAGLVAAMPEAAAGALAALAMTIGGGHYPPRRAGVMRLAAALAAGARGHTLGGCRFVRWRNRLLVWREPAHAAAPIRLAPGASLFWDRRFLVSLPPTAAGPVTVSYLGAGGVIALARHIEPRDSRRRPPLPRLVYPALPAVHDERGLAAVPHLGYRRAAAPLPIFLFRPANPLTLAGFTVV